MALQDRAQGQAPRLIGGKVLEAVHREVDLARGEGLLDLLDEKPLASGRRQRNVGPLVPLGPDDPDLDLLPGPAGTLLSDCSRA